MTVMEQLFSPGVDNSFVVLICIILFLSVIFFIQSVVVFLSLQLSM